MFTFKNHNIQKIGIIGSGQIGPDIALYFSKVFTRYEVPVVVVDISEEALKKGETKVYKKIDKGIETGAFKPEVGEKMKANLTFTSDYEALRGASFVVEAATENRDLKEKIFSQIESICAKDAAFASNSSHMEPESIFGNLPFKNRAMVIHYFFPAERNPMVEIVPGAATEAALIEWVMDLYQWMGKVPIEVKSRYGYAIDPIFEGLFQAAALCVEEGLGTTKEVDWVARKTLRLGVGPFTAMNLTGGNPITHHGLAVMHDKIMPYFRSPALMQEAMKTGKPWDVPARGEKMEISPDKADKIARRMTGAYFGLVTEVLDSGITNISDLEMAVEIALVVSAPFKMMNKTGIKESLALVEEYAKVHDGFKVAEVLKRQAEKNTPWRIPVIVRQDKNGVAVLTIRRPAVMNAMNKEAFTQLKELMEEAAADNNIKAVVITGYGKKAFVSGADVGFLAKIESPEMGEQTSLESQAAINAIEDCPKPVVCALNGIAFGGGNEIAMGCHARIALKDLKVLAAQPEPNLGIIPGAGATQRLPRLVGIEKAAELLRTGRPLSAREALDIGLVDRGVDGDLIECAAGFARDLADGRAKPHCMEKGPLAPPQALPQVDIGHLSRAVDAIICRAVVEGTKKPLREGLKLEARLFGEVCKTEDMKIGVRNFLKNGPRSKADFVHR